MYLYGPLLIDVCKTANMFIVNGRITNDSRYNPTFKHISTTDYCLCCPVLFKHINNFIVHDGNSLFSDGHSVLRLVLDTVLIAGTGRQCHIAQVSKGQQSDGSIVREPSSSVPLVATQMGTW